MMRPSQSSVKASGGGTSPISQLSQKVGNQTEQRDIVPGSSSARSSEVEPLEDIRQRVQQESTKRGFPSTSGPNVGHEVPPGSKRGVFGRLKMQRMKRLRAFRESSGVIYESSDIGNLPNESANDSPVHPRTLSQLSLYDLSFSDPNFIAVTGWKPSAKHTRQKPRLKRYFNEPKVFQEPTATGRLSYCCICGRAAYDFNPLIKVCHCFTESHSNCVVRQIISTGNYSCPLCNTTFNLNYGGCKPFWKVRGVAHRAIQHGAILPSV